MKYLHLILGPKPNIINNDKNKGQETTTVLSYFHLLTVVLGN